MASMKNTNITITEEQQKAAIVSFITLVIMAILGPFLCLGVGWIFGFIAKITVDVYKRQWQEIQLCEWIFSIYG